MSRPLAIDLFCGAGGAAMGLHRAGFDVIGVDIKPQPRYPFTFVQGDALTPPVDLSRADFIWASPPCQHFTCANNRDPDNRHPDLIDPTRSLLISSGAVWTIENVPGAPIRVDCALDGSMFPDLRVLRRRHFELSFGTLFRLGFDARHHPSRHGWSTSTDGDTSSHTRAARAKNGLPVRESIEQRRSDMGINWPMNRREAANAIPPAYSEFIGRAALAWINTEARAA
jgi:DNA (cytosine-5)-methyltransferase 1